MASLPSASSIPHKPLSNWNRAEILACVQNVPVLASAIASVRTAMIKHEINGRVLERRELPSEILEEMFPKRLQRRRFLAEIQNWKRLRSQIIRVRCSTGEDFTLSGFGWGGISLETKMTQIRAMIERKLKQTQNDIVPGRCALMDTHGRHLADDQEATLALNDIRWGSEIFVDVAPRQVPEETGEEKEGGIRHTDAPDLITLETDPRYPRARMPCSDLRLGDLLFFFRLMVEDNENLPPPPKKREHGMTAMSMKLHIQDSLRRYQFEIFCPDPSCRTQWDWDLCLRIAQLNHREIDEINRKRAENQAAAVNTVKICPNERCGQPIAKPESLRTIRVNCPSCSSRDICWRCLKPWKNLALFGGFCGNQGCDSEVLKKCKVQTISGEDRKQYPDFPAFPIARSCPRCETLVVHREQCKHVHCSNCSLQFCMSCLKPRGKGDWTCGSPFGPCPDGVAPRQ